MFAAAGIFEVEALDDAEDEAQFFEGRNIPTFKDDVDIGSRQLKPVLLVLGVVLHRFVQAVATEVYRD